MSGDDLVARRTGRRGHWWGPGRRSACEDGNSYKGRAETHARPRLPAGGPGRAARGRAAVPGADGGVDPVDGGARCGARQVVRLHHGLCADGGW
jgi:hypothetical protein